MSETRCSLVEKEKKRYNNSGKKNVPRTERELKRRSGRHVDVAKTSLELAVWRKLQQKSLNTLGLCNEKEKHQRHEVRSCQRRWRLLSKEKAAESSKSRDHEKGESQDGRLEPKKRRVRTETWSKEREGRQNNLHGRR